MGRYWLLKIKVSDRVTSLADYRQTGNRKLQAAVGKVLFCHNLLGFSSPIFITLKDGAVSCPTIRVTWNTETTRPAFV